METTSESVNDKNGGADWKQVALASEEAEANTWEEETVEDVIDVKLTDADMADLLRANGADEEAKATVDADLSRLKEEVKEKKSESEAIAARMKDRNRAGARGTVAKKGPWRLLTCFSLNAVRYVDPATGLVVHERACTSSERQTSLAIAPVVDINGARKDSASDSIDDPEALLRAAEAGDAKSADEVEPEDESLDSEDDGDDS